MSIRIALAGNPNCGKTTMFNTLTGSSQYVGNWPGVTVEKKEGRLKGKQKDVIVVDLPGIYSLSPYTLEEVITRDYLINDKPDVIINIIDATNLERNLYLTTQLLEVGLPVIIALNMMDIVSKGDGKIDVAGLAAELGCTIIGTSAVKGTGIKEIAQKAIEIAEAKTPALAKHKFSKNVQEAIAAIEKIIPPGFKGENRPWFALKLFERDEKVEEQINFDAAAKEKIRLIIEKCEKAMDDDSESIIANERYEYITEIISKFAKRKTPGALSRSDKIDRIVTNRWLALPIFFLIMWGVYYVSIQTVGEWTIVWLETLIEDIIGGGLLELLETAGAASWLQSLIIEGILGGVGTVIVFVPQLMILFFFISLLEDCGYMARVAFIMDRVFRRFGLSGKSFIPMLIGTGCTVPAVMASRTIEQEKDRKMTVMLTPFIPCGAKLPLFALMTAAFFPEDVWVGPSMYFLGIAMVIISGVILKRTPLFAGETAPFVMELPIYHMPRAKGVLIHMWERGKAFVIKAGTIIFVGSAVIWFLQSFNLKMEMVEAGESILAALGGFIAPIFAPLGFGTWQASVATITGSLAKEIVVATFGVLFGIGEVAESDPHLVSEITTIFTFVGAYAFMVFNLLAAPCFAAIGAIKREMGSWKWTLIAVGYQTGLAYLMALIINQVGSAIFLGTNKIPAIIVSGILLALIFWALASGFKRSKKALGR